MNRLPQQHQGHIQWKIWQVVRNHTARRRNLKGQTLVHQCRFEMVPNFWIFQQRLNAQHQITTMRFLQQTGLMVHRQGQRIGSAGGRRIDGVPEQLGHGGVLLIDDRRMFQMPVIHQQIDFKHRKTVLFRHQFFHRGFRIIGDLILRLIPEQMQFANNRFFQFIQITFDRFCLTEFHFQCVNQWRQMFLGDLGIQFTTRFQVFVL